jgi:hypothetical protein
MRNNQLLLDNWPLTLWNRVKLFAIMHGYCHMLTIVRAFKSFSFAVKVVIFLTRLKTKEGKKERLKFQME